MAVTKVDQQRLNNEGVQVVQKATSLWEDANRRGDTAGMKAAAEMAAAARSNSAYQSVAGSAGYTTDSSGYNFGGTAPVTKPITQAQPRAPIVQQPVAPTPDPVAQLVSAIVNSAQPRGYAASATDEGRGGSYVAPAVQQPVQQPVKQPVRDYATSPTQEGRGGSYVAPPVTSAPVNPYNANTNFENERRFLNNLIATGSAHDRLWAQGQLTLLEAEASKYAMAPNLEGRGGSFEQLAILPNTGSIYPLPDIPGVNTGVQPTNIYPLPGIPGITQPAPPVDTGLGSGVTNGMGGGAGNRFEVPASTPPVVDSSAPTYADRADAEGRGGSFEPVVPSTQRDIAAEIVALLTKGGPIDYDKLNLLVKERDAKLRSNPDLYGQFESTQSILDKYLYSAQNSENSSEANKPTSVTGNTDVVSSVTPTTPTTPTVPVTPTTPTVPVTPTTPTVPVTPTTVTPTTNPEIDALISALRALSGPIQETSYGDAKLRAEGELNPLYHDAAAELRRSLDLDMERRGIYNSPFASGIMTEKQGKLTNQQISDVSRRANEIIQNDRTLSLQDRQIQSNTLSGLLSALMGRESNIAELTGYLNGQPTVANQVAQSNIKNNTLNGILNTINTTGKITTQEQADLLGLKIGDSTLQAKTAAEQLDLQIRQLEADTIYKQGSLANQQANTALANTAQNLEAALNAWKSSGVAPNLPILQQYGIQPGTAYTGGSSVVEQKLAEAQAQLQLAAAEEELSFQTRASEYATSFKIPVSTAEYLVFITDQSSDYNMALQTLMAKKNEIAADGVNITQLTEAIKQFYKVSSLSTGEPFSEVIHTET